MAVAFPGESAEYRVARNRLLDQEIELRRGRGGRLMTVLQGTLESGAPVSRLMSVSPTTPRTSRYHRARGGSRPGSAGEELHGRVVASLCGEQL